MKKWRKISMGILSRIFDKVTPDIINTNAADWNGIHVQGLKDGVNKPTIPFDERLEEKINQIRMRTKEDSIMIDNNHETKLGGTDMERKNKDTLEVYEELMEAMHQTYISKNADYGNSFGVSLDKRGLVAALVRMEDKLNRLDQLKDGERNLVGESLMDTALDLANYALMTAVWLNQQEKETYKVYANDKIVAEFPKELGEQTVKIDQGVLTSDSEINIQNVEIDPIEITVTPRTGTEARVDSEEYENLIKDTLENHEKGRWL